MQSSQTTHQVGPALPENASPGLRFLHVFLPSYNKLQLQTAQTKALFAPHAQGIFNEEPPCNILQWIESLSTSGDFGSMPTMAPHGYYISSRELIRAWDVSPPEPSFTDRPEPADAAIARQTKRRTVLFESVADTVFKVNAEHRVVRVAEFHVVELEAVGGDGGSGFEGLWLVEWKICRDTGAVMRMRERETLYQKKMEVDGHDMVMRGGPPSQ